MPIVIRPWAPEHAAAIREFNRRLEAGGAQARFPEGPSGDWRPGTRAFLALDGDCVRGGYLLRPERFHVNGRTCDVVHYRLPVSEGIVNRAYTALAVQMLRTALQTCPRLYALGMGGFHQPLPKLLKNMGWSLCAVPFWFRVVHPAAFLRNVRTQRTAPLRRLALDVAAFTGAGWAALKLVHRLRTKVTLKPGEPAADFGSWADETWEAAAGRCALAAVRDRATLNTLYPPGDPRYVRVRAGGGWALAIHTPMRDDKYFGCMHVGTIVDCLAPPGGMAAAIAAAVRELQERGVDLVISNQAHQECCSALHNLGFLEGPSNFAFAASKELAALLQPWDAARPRFHLNRGDGDGPVHL